MKLFILIFLLLSIIYPESELLRSKYLTLEMAEDVNKLERYNRTAKFIFNNYDKAKFYQMVA